MNKTYLLIIVGILLVGTISAITLSNVAFSKEITSISSKLFCDKLSITKLCAKDIPLTNTGLSIKQDPKTLVYEVKAK